MLSSEPGCQTIPRTLQNLGGSKLTIALRTLLVATCLVIAPGAGFGCSPRVVIVPGILFDGPESHIEEQLRDALLRHQQRLFDRVLVNDDDIQFAWYANAFEEAVRDCTPRYDAISFPAKRIEQALAGKGNNVELFDLFHAFYQLYVTDPSIRCKADRSVAALVGENSDCPLTVLAHEFGSIVAVSALGTVDPQIGVRLVTTSSPLGLAGVLRDLLAVSDSDPDLVRAPASIVSWSNFLYQSDPLASYFAESLEPYDLVTEWEEMDPDIGRDGSLLDYIEHPRILGDLLEVHLPSERLVQFPEGLDNLADELLSEVTRTMGTHKPDLLVTGDRPTGTAPGRLIILNPEFLEQEYSNQDAPTSQSDVLRFVLAHENAHLEQHRRNSVQSVAESECEADVWGGLVVALHAEFDSEFHRLLDSVNDLIAFSAELGEYFSVKHYQYRDQERHPSPETRALCTASGINLGMSFVSGTGSLGLFSNELLWHQTGSLSRSWTSGRGTAGSYPQFPERCVLAAESGPLALKLLGSELENEANLYGRRCRLLEKKSTVLLRCADTVRFPPNLQREKLKVTIRAFEAIALPRGWSPADSRGGARLDHDLSSIKVDLSDGLIQVDCQTQEIEPPQND